MLWYLRGIVTTYYCNRNQEFTKKTGNPFFKNYHPDFGIERYSFKREEKKIRKISVHRICLNILFTKANENYTVEVSVRSNDTISDTRNNYL